MQVNSCLCTQNERSLRQKWVCLSKDLCDSWVENLGYKKYFFFLWGNSKQISWSRLNLFWNMSHKRSGWSDVRFPQTASPRHSSALSTFICLQVHSTFLCAKMFVLEDKNTSSSSFFHSVMNENMPPAAKGEGTIQCILTAPSSTRNGCWLSAMLPGSPPCSHTAKLQDVHTHANVDSQKLCHVIRL